MLFGKNVRADEPANSGGKHSAPTHRVQRSPLAANPPSSTPASQDEDSRVLIVGGGMRLKGEITACDRLVVEGHVEASLNEAHAVVIRSNGRFVGSCEVEEAEIGGVYEGNLTVSRRLTIRASGQVEGEICYGEIELERGGRISGNLRLRG
jgi:cytoskeletal protein CcmA (bactofilin family)